MNIPQFLITRDEVLDRVKALNPSKYAKTRNFLNGQVSYLSPFITHGVISTKTVADVVLEKYSVRDSEKLLAELGWREFFHRVWQDQGENIFNDLRYDQAKVISEDIPKAVTQANIGLTALDDSLKKLIETGYMHNHARMWTGV